MSKGHTMSKGDTMGKAVYNKPTLTVIGTISDITEQFKHPGTADAAQDYNFS